MIDLTREKIQKHANEIPGKKRYLHKLTKRVLNHGEIAQKERKI